MDSDILFRRDQDKDKGVNVSNSQQPKVGEIWWTWFTGTGRLQKLRIEKNKHWSRVCSACSQVRPEKKDNPDSLYAEVSRGSALLLGPDFKYNFQRLGLHWPPKRTPTEVRKSSARLRVLQRHLRGLQKKREDALALWTKEELEIKEELRLTHKAQGRGEK